MFLFNVLTSIKLNSWYFLSTIDFESCFLIDFGIGLIVFFSILFEVNSEQFVNKNNIDIRIK